MWLLLYYGVMPGALLMACVPIARARERALAGTGREAYLRRVAVLILLLLVLGVSFGELASDLPLFWGMILGPGAVLAAIRLWREMPHLRRVVSIRGE
jgi:hypothetical protein